MKIGIVGLPNVGKSTLFKALTKKQVEASNYPFCTIDPNIGVVEVPDERVEKLAKIYNSKKIIHATIEFVDIAGLVKNASKGEGLGNKFLSHIREVDAIVHVIRNFHDDNITHVQGKIDPQSDLKTIVTELAMADLTVTEKYLSKLKDKIKSGDKNATKSLAILEQIKTSLDQAKKPDISDLNEDELKLIKGLNLLTLKPELFILNVDESVILSERSESNDPVNIASNTESFNSVQDDVQFIPICAKLESEFTDPELLGTEFTELADEFGLKKSGLDKLITASYKLLNLITFFTAGPKESHAWTIKKGTKAPQAAGKIHTDFEKGFIRAEMINWKNLIEVGGDVKAKEKGLMKMEGKNYTVQDGDVAVFHFS